ncbi:MAG: PorT family protein [Bacteroidales bacterium]|nr:PorT family protein [Bacteroidales bacterium]MBR4001090.1 PorT family protein [Bacteroidales bacterium]
MKKALSIVLAAGLLLAGTNAFAQISVGAGYSNVTQRIKASGLNKDVTMHGLYAGMDYNIPISENISIAPGLYYEFSNGSADRLLNIGSVSSLLLKGRLEEHYIDIPFKFMFSVPYQGNKFFAFAGPTASIGVSSKIKGDVKLLGFELKGDVLDMYDKNIFEGMDLMLGGGIGADIGKMLRVTLGYNVGMFNRLDMDSNQTQSTSESGSGFNVGQLVRDNATINRQQFYVGVAVLF